MPGFIITTVDGALVQTIAFELADAKHISGIYVMRNPDKLSALRRLGPL